MLQRFWLNISLNLKSKITHIHQCCHGFSNNASLNLKSKIKNHQCYHCLRHDIWLNLKSTSPMHIKVVTVLVLMSAISPKSKITQVRWCYHSFILNVSPNLKSKITYVHQFFMVLVLMSASINLKSKKGSTFLKSYLEMFDDGDLLTTTFLIRVTSFLKISWCQFLNFFSSSAIYLLHGRG